MRVAVVGAGIVGVTTAYELAADGHTVAVYERRGSVAAETSYANAGLVAPGYVTPWAAPGMPMKVLRQLTAPHAAVRVGGVSVLRHLPWLLRWWRACRPETYAANRAALFALARASQQRLETLARTLHLDYEQRRGVLVLLRSDADLGLARNGLKLLAEMGVGFELLDAARARKVEPGLNADQPLRAAIHLPDDSVGNCRSFAQALRNEAQRLGAAFHFDMPVLRIVPGTRPALQTPAGERRHDAVVLCSGIDSNALLRPLRLALPLMPVYGCSVTMPLRQLDGHPDFGPRAALMDERFKVAISRLGQRVRVAGSAEIGGSLERMNERALATLYQVLDDWFPGAALKQQAQGWKGARPMLPDGPPVLGASGADGVWLNLGHGSSGWALACGSARALAALINGDDPALDMAPFAPSRVRQ